MKIKNRFDRVLKMLTVFAMTMSCFVDMPIRVVAESFDVDSVISIESHNNETDVNDSEASLAVSAVSYTHLPYYKTQKRPGSRGDAGKRQPSTSGRQKNRR